jgi:hypothetical protein
MLKNDQPLVSAIYIYTILLWPKDESTSLIIFNNLKNDININVIWQFRDGSMIW